jgi:hypothetical protein
MIVVGFESREAILNGVSHAETQNASNTIMHPGIAFQILNTIYACTTHPLAAPSVSRFLYAPTMLDYRLQCYRR